MTNPLVSVIIPSWGRKDDVLKTLDDLAGQTYRNFETIVVEQGNIDGAREAIRSRHPGARLICLEKGVGAPAARNRGADEARGEILVFVDNDASLENSAIEATVTRMAGEPDIGLVGFRILDAATAQLDTASWTYPRARIRESEKEFETCVFCGCGYAMRRDLFLKGAKYWEEAYWFAEEQELSLRVLNLGRRILYLPSAVVYHRTAAEQRPSRMKRNHYNFRNILWFTWRYYPFWNAVGETFLRTGAYVLKGLRGGFLWAIVTGGFDSLKKIHLLFDSKDRMKPEVWRRYRRLSSRGSAWQVLRGIWRFDK